MPHRNHHTEQLFKPPIGGSTYTNFRKGTPKSSRKFVWVSGIIPSFWTTSAWLSIAGLAGLIWNTFSRKIERLYHQPSCFFPRNPTNSTICSLNLPGRETHKDILQKHLQGKGWLSRNIFRTFQEHIVWGWVKTYYHMTGMTWGINIQRYLRYLRVPSVPGFWLTAIFRYHYECWLESPLITAPKNLLKSTYSCHDVFGIVVPLGSDNGLFPWLVVDLPLWKIWKSLGIFIPSEK